MRIRILEHLMETHPNLIKTDEINKIDQINTTAQ